MAEIALERTRAGVDVTPPFGAQHRVRIRGHDAHDAVLELGVALSAPGVRRVTRKQDHHTAGAAQHQRIVEQLVHKGIVEQLVHLHQGVVEQLVHKARFCRRRGCCLGHGLGGRLRGLWSLRRLRRLGCWRRFGRWRRLHGFRRGFRRRGFRRLGLLLQLRSGLALDLRQFLQVLHVPFQERNALLRIVQRVLFRRHVVGRRGARRLRAALGIVGAREA